MQAPQSGRKQASAVKKAVGLQKHEPERHREEVVLPDGCVFRAEYFESQAQKLSVQDPYVHRRAIFLFIVFLSAAALLFGVSAVGVVMRMQHFRAWSQGYHLRLPVMCVVVMLLTVPFSFTRWFVTEDGVTAIRNAGVELTTHYWSGAKETKFVDISHLRSIVLNEGFTRCSVIFYLALVLQNAESLTVLFPNFRLRLPLVEHTYHTLRHIFFDDPAPPRLRQDRLNEALAASERGGDDPARHLRLGAERPAAPARVRRRRRARSDDTF